MSTKTTEPRIRESTWETLRKALEAAIVESAPAGQGAAPSGPSPESLKNTVTQAVGAVLLDGDILEKCIVHTISHLEGEARAKVAQGLVPQEDIQRACQEVFRSLTTKHIVPAIQNEIKEIVLTNVREFGKSEEFKELIDSRFRMIEAYLRSDVIPKVVEKLLTKR